MSHLQLQALAYTFYWGKQLPWWWWFPVFPWSSVHHPYWGIVLLLGDFLHLPDQPVEVRREVVVRDCSLVQSVVSPALLLSLNLSVILCLNRLWIPLGLIMTFLLKAIRNIHVIGTQLLLNTVTWWGKRTFKKLALSRGWVRYFLFHVL